MWQHLTILIEALTAFAEAYQRMKISFMRNLKR